MICSIFHYDCTDGFDKCTKYCTNMYMYTSRYILFFKKIIKKKLLSVLSFKSFKKSSKNETNVTKISQE